MKHKLVVKGLGFTRLNQIVEREDTPSIRGMVEGHPAPGPDPGKLVQEQSSSGQSRIRTESLEQLHQTRVGWMQTAGARAEEINAKESIQFARPKKANSGQEACRPRYGLRHGQDFNPRPQGPAFALRLAA